MLRAFLESPSGVLGLAVLALLVGVSIVAPPTLGAQARVVDVFQGGLGPSAEHWLGTDNLGRDILFRVLVATPVSLGLAVAAAGLGALIGIPVGAGTVILPASLRSIVLRSVDALIAFPGVLIAIFVGAIVGPGTVGATLGVAIAISFNFARIASTLAMVIGGREYVAAARVAGIGRSRLVLRHVLPNILDTLAITTTVVISSSVVQLSSLSFLGLGVLPPEYDWGRMLTEGVQAFYIAPVAALAPAMAIAVTSLAFGFTGEALARATNPLLWVPSASAGGRFARERSSTQVSFSALEGHRSAGGQSDVALEVENLVVSFPGNGGPVRVVDGVSFSVPRGQLIGIAGESGSGKTMTALAIAQLVPYPATVSGAIWLEGAELSALSRRNRDAILGTRLAIVFQDPLSSLNPVLRILAQMVEGLEVHRSLRRAQAGGLAATRLREVSIPTPYDTLHRFPHELSGGMRQRVMIAKGLMKEPALLIADEPTTALDVTIQAQIVELLSKINREHGTAVILISHNLALMSQICRRVLVMYAGSVVEDLTTEQLLSTPLHPYTAALLRAVPDMSQPRNAALGTIPGQVPDAGSLPTGCPYHPRCPLALDICRDECPPLRVRPDGRRVACWVANRDLD